MRFVLVYVLCSFCSLIVRSQELGKIRVDPSKSYGGMISEFFETVEYIPLETTKESLFGATHKMVITESGIVVGDNDTHSLLFFNLRGKFIKKHAIKKELGFLLDYDSKTKTVILSIAPFEAKGTEEIRTYSPTGTLLKTEKRKYNLLDRTERIRLDSGFYSMHQFTRIPIKTLPQDVTIPLVRVYNKKDSLHQSFLPFKPEDNPFLFARVGGATFTPGLTNSQPAFVVVPYDYRLFRLTKDSLQLMGQFVFPARYVVPEKTLKSKNYKLLDSVSKAFSRDFFLVQSVRDISFYKQKMLFRLEKVITLMPDESGIIYDPINFIYDTASRRVISFERMTPDSVSYYLPIMDGFSSISGMNHRNGNLYASISSLNMFKAMDKTKGKNPQYPVVLQQYFKTQDRKSNPVIVRMKLKE